MRFNISPIQTIILIDCNVSKDIQMMSKYLP